MIMFNLDKMGQAGLINLKFYKGSNPFTVKPQQLILK